jgi:hypothetical protein
LLVRPTTLAWVTARTHFPLSTLLNTLPNFNRLAIWDAKPVKNPTPRNITEEDLLADPPVVVREPPLLSLEGLEGFGKLEKVKRVEVVFRDDREALSFWKLH